MNLELRGISISTSFFYPRNQADYKTLLDDPLEQSAFLLHQFEPKLLPISLGF